MAVAGTVSDEVFLCSRKRAAKRLHRYAKRLIRKARKSYRAGDSVKSGLLCAQAVLALNRAATVSHTTRCQHDDFTVSVRQ